MNKNEISKYDALTQHMELDLFKLQRKEKQRKLTKKRQKKQLEYIMGITKEVFRGKET